MYYAFYDIWRCGSAFAFVLSLAFWQPNLKLNEKPRYAWWYSAEERKLTPPSVICLTATKTNLEYFSSPDNTFLGFENSDKNVIPPIPSTNDIECEERIEDVKLSYGTEQGVKSKTQFLPKWNTSVSAWPRWRRRKKMQWGKGYLDEESPFGKEI